MKLVRPQQYAFVNQQFKRYEMWFGFCQSSGNLCYM
jgi:hypothetical protein